MRAVFWGDMEEARVKGWLSRTLKLKYRNGRSETYWRLRGDDARKIKALLEALLPASSGDTSPAQGMVSLCPKCLAALEPNIYRCGKCALNFKNAQSMVRRAWLIPGGGYIYTGQRYLGVVSFLVEGVLLFWTVVWALVAAGILPEPDLKPGEQPATAPVALVAAALIAGVLGLEKLLAIHHCRRFIREYIPIE